MKNSDKEKPSKENKVKIYEQPVAKPGSVDLIEKEYPLYKSRFSGIAEEAVLMGTEAAQAAFPKRNSSTAINRATEKPGDASSAGGRIDKVIKAVTDAMESHDILPAGRLKKALQYAQKEGRFDVHTMQESIRRKLEKAESVPGDKKGNLR